jgi:pilus assembly protein FimV
VESSGIDFAFDSPEGAIDDSQGESVTARQGVQGLRSDFDGYAPTINIPGPEGEGPTVEQPQLTETDALRKKLDGAVGKLGSSDQTAELALDDLGLDLGSLDATDGATLDESQVARVLSPPDAPTLIADMDDTIRRQILGAGSTEDHATTRIATPDLSTSESGSWLFDESDADPLARTSESPAGETQAVRALDMSFGGSGETTEQPAATPVDFDVDNLSSATGMHLVPADGDFGLDLDVGMAEQPDNADYAKTQRVSAEDLGMQDLEPATMSEVGTKLDLARAYMDMGDPDGARSILAEVLSEGSVNQKQEAQRLLDSIPG